MLEDHWYIEQPSVSQHEHLQQCRLHFLPGPFIISGLPVLMPTKRSFPSVRELTLRDSDKYFETQLTTQQSSLNLES